MDSDLSSFPDLAKCPSTKKGALSVINTLTPNLLRLWRRERLACHTDDLVAIINLVAGDIRVEPRSTVCAKLKKANPKLDLIDYVTKPAPNNRSCKGSVVGHEGSITIWVIVGFADGSICALPTVLLRS